MEFLVKVWINPRRRTHRPLVQELAFFFCNPLASNLDRPTIPEDLLDLSSSTQSSPEVQRSQFSTEPSRLKPIATVRFRSEGANFLTRKMLFLSFDANFRPLKLGTVAVRLSTVRQMLPSYCPPLYWHPPLTAELSVKYFDRSHDPSWRSSREASPEIFITFSCDEI